MKVGQLKDQLKMILSMEMNRCVWYVDEGWEGKSLYTDCDFFMTDCEEEGLKTLKHDALEMSIMASMGNLNCASIDPQLMDIIDLVKDDCEKRGDYSLLKDCLDEIKAYVEYYPVKKMSLYDAVIDLIFNLGKNFSDEDEISDSFFTYDKKWEL